MKRFLMHLLHAIHRRLCQIFDKQELFGGCHVMAFGDLAQLRPPEGVYIFEDDGQLPAGMHLWRTSFIILELFENMRTGPSRDYADLLQRVRFGRMQDGDWIHAFFGQRLIFWD